MAFFIGLRKSLDISRLVGAADQKYAEAVLKNFLDADTLVPNLWHLEASNVLVGKKADIKFYLK